MYTVYLKIKVNNINNQKLKLIGFFHSFYKIVEGSMIKKNPLNILKNAKKTFFYTFRIERIVHIFYSHKTA